MKKLLLILICLFGINSFVKAEYIATGKIQGCDWKFGGFAGKCGIEIKAFKKNGQFYELENVYPKVDEYNKTRHNNKDYYMCHIRLYKGQVSKYLNNIKKLFSDDGFYTIDNEGNYKRINNESISFKCIKNE